MKFLLTIISSVLTLIGQAQESKALLLVFEPRFQGESLVLSESEAPSIATFKCYVSEFTLLNKGEEVWSEVDSYHLMDAEQSESMMLELNVPKNLEFDQMKWLVGIDSTISVSGVFGGDLDPSSGMYWTWNSGYINFKLEGKDARSGDPEKAFEFHIGGYLPPFQTAQDVILNVTNSEIQQVLIDLDELIDSLNLAEDFRIMSAGEKAHRMAQKLETIFSVVK